MNRLGIDIGGTSVKAALFSGGQCVHTGQSPSYARPSTADLLTAIRTATGPVDTLDFVGLCVPGLFDPTKRRVTMAVNVPGLVEIDLDRLVPEALGIECAGETAICTEPAAAAWDLYRMHQPRGRMFALTLGTGAGASVLDDGIPLRVDGDSPGHFGQIDVSIAGHDVIGPDGGAGGLEGYIGAPALRAAYGRDVSAALERFSGDEPAILALARALRIAHAIYRPHHIFLCGGVGIRLRHVLRPIRDRVELQLTTIARPGWTLSCGDDDFHAARGAAIAGQFNAT